MLSAVRHMQNARQSYLFAVRFIKSARQSIFQQFSKIYKNIKFIKLVQTKLCCLLLIETRLEVKLNLNVVSPTNLTISLLQLYETSSEMFRETRIVHEKCSKLIQNFPITFTYYIMRY
jgi:hypothetical protein